MRVVNGQLNGLPVRTVLFDDDLEREEKVKRTKRIYHLTHPDAGPDRSRRWKLRNPELARERQRGYNARWRKQNPEAYKSAYKKSNRRRAELTRLRAMEPITEAEMQALREKQAIKREKQHAAWRKWYDSPKGAAYRQKVKEKRALAK